MKIKVRQMLEANQAALEISRDKLPARASYWVARLLAKLRSEVEIAEGKRVELVKKHGEERKDKEGKVVGFLVPPAKMEEFRREYEPIAEDSIDIEIQPLNIGVFDGASIAPQHLMALEPLLVDPQE